jgi:predicted transcriptional regulator
LNYLAEILAFNNWIEFNSNINKSDVCLWHALMAMANRFGWKEFNVPISVLTLKSKLNRSSIYRSRNKLKQLGLIEFTERSGNQCSVYKINSITKIYDRNTAKIKIQNDTQIKTTKIVQCDTKCVKQSDTQQETRCGIQIVQCDTKCVKQSDTQQETRCGTQNDTKNEIIKIVSQYDTQNDTQNEISEFVSQYDTQSGTQSGTQSETIHKTKNQKREKENPLKGVKEKEIAKNAKSVLSPENKRGELCAKIKLVSSRQANKHARFRKETKPVLFQANKRGELCAKIKPVLFQENNRKDSYGEFSNVLLSAGEVDKLGTRLGKTAEGYINYMSCYLESSGKKYKSHYATILSWLAKDKLEAMRKREETKISRPSYDLAEYERISLASFRRMRC